MITSSITDSPRNSRNGEIDIFGIEPFEKGLTNFIGHTSTPITIALQGEWGSGKTSLMNSLCMNLCDEPDNHFHSVWINTWEYALMKDSESTLMDIIAGLVRQITTISKLNESDAKKLLDKVWSLGKTTAKFVAKAAAEKTIEGSSGLIDELLSESGKTIGQIRNELEHIIETCISKDNRKGIVFFIDDLDRIDPPIAVNLLELLKNIFTLKNCIFILAIDYDVVVKGLEPKFGKLTEFNEREFRSFFDKIIQVPFSMPVATYSIDLFLKENLLTTNYLTEEKAQRQDLIKSLSQICNLTVGTNPRSLKRLLNSLSLITYINSAKGNLHENDQLNEDIELIVNFALVSIQIAYPPVYRLLNMYPGFDNWNEKIALQMNLKELDEQSRLKLDKSEEFDEEWEKVLFRLCENDPYLKRKALNISVLLNSLKSQIKDTGEDVENVIGSIVSLSSVTTIEAFDKPVVDYHRGEFLKTLRRNLIPKLKTALPEISNLIANQGKRVQSNAYIKLSQKDWGHYIKFFSHPFEGKVRLMIISDKWICPTNNKSFEECLRNVDLLSSFEQIENDYNSIVYKHQGFTALGLRDELRIKENVYVVELYHYYVLNNTDAFMTPEALNKITAVIVDIYGILVRLNDLSMNLKMRLKEEIHG